MTCTDFCQLMGALIAHPDRSTTAELAAAAGHMMACPECKEEMKAQSLASMRRMTPPQVIAKQLEAQAAHARIMTDPEARAVLRPGETEARPA